MYDLYRPAIDIVVYKGHLKFIIIFFWPGRVTEELLAVVLMFMIESDRNYQVARFCSLHRFEMN
jgi:hypothetical protein